MFAPPPVQLSLAEIQKLKLERDARAAEKAARQEQDRMSGSLESNGESPVLLQRTESSGGPKAARKKGALFKRSGTGKLKVSKPIAIRVLQQTEEESSRDGRKGMDAADTSEKVGEVKEQQFRPTPFAEQPRKAPVPPKRPGRPSSELFLPPLPGASPTAQFSILGSRETSHPVLSEVSQRRQSNGLKEPGRLPAIKQQPEFTKASLHGGLAELKNSNAIVAETGEERRSAALPRSSTASASAGRNSSIPPWQSPTSAFVNSKRATVGSMSTLKPKTRRTSGIQGGKVTKSATVIKRQSVNATLWEAMQAMDDMNLQIKQQPRRNTEPLTKVLQQKASTPPEALMPWKRRRKGETLSMLLASDFFPIKDPVIGKRIMRATDVGLRINVQADDMLGHLPNKDLPNTPDSILLTPMEMYHDRPRVPRPVTRRRAASKQRSPLTQISAVNAKANSKGRHAEDLSPSRLAAIPESISISENSAPSSGVTTPTATQLHLRGGSVITLMPPELTAWQRHAYLQGPIKLPKPITIPRKNSVASLDPFQEAIDQVYQEALHIPRRRSDDAVVDDICEWFEEFGFAEVKFEGDALEIENVVTGEVEEMKEATGHEIERFSTPPPEPVASPVGKVVAKEVVEMRARRPGPTPPIPPVENDETLRATGITRLPQPSLALHKEPRTLENPLPLPPVPEQSMFDASIELGPTEKEQQGPVGVRTRDPGFDWDEVEEIDPEPDWVAPTITHRKQSLNSNSSKSDTASPVAKVRRPLSIAGATL